MKRRGRANQIWSMEKLENKIIDMREMYEERKSQGLPMMVQNVLDVSDAEMSFFDISEGNMVCLLHCMACVWQDCVLHDYTVSQHTVNTGHSATWDYSWAASNAMTNFKILKFVLISNLVLSLSFKTQ